MKSIENAYKSIVLENVEQDSVVYLSEEADADFDQLDEAKRTDAYQYTHTPGNPHHEKKLQALKDYVSAHNADPENKNKLRVTMNGRLGKNNPNAVNYAGKGMNSHQRIRKADAAHFDVYVHDRGRN